jgi:hypothetical protein
VGIIQRVPINDWPVDQDETGHAVYSLENAIDDIRQMAAQFEGEDWRRICDAWADLTKTVHTRQAVRS